MREGKTLHLVNERSVQGLFAVPFDIISLKTDSAQRSSNHGTVTFQILLETSPTVINLSSWPRD